MATIKVLQQQQYNRKKSGAAIGTIQQQKQELSCSKRRNKSKAKTWLQKEEEETRHSGKRAYRLLCRNLPPLLSPNLPARSICEETTPQWHAEYSSGLSGLCVDSYPKEGFNTWRTWFHTSKRITLGFQSTISADICGRRSLV